MSERLVIDISRDSWGNATRLVAYIGSTPSPGHAVNVVFRKSFLHARAGVIKMTGTIALSAVKPAEHVSSRQVTVTLDGTALPPIEAVNSPAMFTANDGQAYSISVVDSNAVGPAGPGPLLTGIAALPLNAPTPGFATGVVFTP